MKIKEKLNHFWKVTLGPDYEEQIDIENSTNPELQELKASLKRVKAMEKDLSYNNNAKGGKGRVVQAVAVDHKTINLAKQKQTKITEKEGKERE